MRGGVVGQEMGAGMSFYDQQEPDDALGPPPVAPPARPRSLLATKATWRHAVAIILAIVLFRMVLLESAIVEGNSMASTLLNEEWVLVRKPLHPHRFSVIVFTDPQEGTPVIKRVVGLPGDTLSQGSLDAEGQPWPDTRISINDALYTEPYAREAQGGIIPPLQVPENAYFVLGDNRDDSIDSRSYGPVQKNSVRGVAVAVIWPLSRMRMIPAEAEPAAAGPAVAPTAPTQ